MAENSLSVMVSRFKGLPKNQQLAIIFGVPAFAFLVFTYLTWQVMAQLGADPGVPPIFRREGMGKWSEISAVDVQIAEKQAVINRRPEIERKLGEIQTEIAEAEERLPREAEKAQMREVIERLARDIPTEIGVVKLKSVRIIEDESGQSAIVTGAGSRRGTLRTITYQTEVSGDLNGIIKYIDSIEKNKRFMSVSTISFRGGGVKADGEAKGKIQYELHTVKMDLVTYVYATSGKAKVAQ